MASHALHQDGGWCDNCGVSRRGRDERHPATLLQSAASILGNLIALARGADILVHDALYEPGVNRLVAGVPNAATLKESIMSHHTTAEDAGRVAQRAGVKTLVLSHFVPADDPSITDEMWTSAARRYFRGTVIVGKDLMEIS